MTELKRLSSIRKIADILGRSPFSISRKIKQSPDLSSRHVQVANQVARTRKRRYDIAHRKKLILGGAP